MAASQLTDVRVAADHQAPMSETEVRAHEKSSYVRPAARRVAAVGVIGRARGRTVSTVRTAEGVTGTVTAVTR